MPAASILTYTCILTDRQVTEFFSTRRAARTRAVGLSVQQLARNIRIINHPTSTPHTRKRKAH